MWILEVSFMMEGRREVERKRELLSSSTAAFEREDRFRGEKVEN